MKINILIRVHGRLSELKKCIDSVRSQTYKNVHIIASYEDERDLGMLIDLGINDIHYVRYPRVKCFYNLYCNDLKSKVTSGWFLYLDSDDTLVSDTCIEELLPYLTHEVGGIICQFKRLWKLKPSDEQIDNHEVVCGKIGMPCIVLHHSQKNIARIGDETYSDYSFIKEVTTKIPTKFIKHVLVNSIRRNHGK